MREAINWFNSGEVDSSTLHGSRAKMLADSQRMATKDGTTLLRSSTPEEEDERVASLARNCLPRYAHISVRSSRNSEIIVFHLFKKYFFQQNPKNSVECFARLKFQFHSTNVCEICTISVFIVRLQQNFTC